MDERVIPSEIEASVFSYVNHFFLHLHISCTDVSIILLKKGNIQWPQLCVVPKIFSALYLLLC